MSVDPVIELQNKLKLSTELDAIRANRKLIADTRLVVEAQLKIVLALARANRSMCTHPNRKTYNDPRDPGGWDCPDCGDGG